MTSPQEVLLMATLEQLRTDLENAGRVVERIEGRQDQIRAEAARLEKRLEELGVDLDENLEERIADMQKDATQLRDEIEEELSEIEQAVNAD